MKKTKDENIVWTGTIERHDTYELEAKVPRWILLKQLIRGTSKLQWRVPASKKRKGLYLKGKNLTEQLIEKLK